MGLPKSKNAVGLGNSLMNDRFGKGKGHDMRRGPQGIQRTGPDGQTYITTPKQEAAWVRMQSITEQTALDDFLNTAELAGTDFTAEKLNNVKIIHRDQRNPYLLSTAEEKSTLQKHMINRSRLRVPRRPAWDDSTTAQDLDERERESLVHWRRALAELQESEDLLMTPFERNIEVWRQLWRVIERSDLVVQIVDARNPLLFRCEDLEKYVKEVDPRKNNLLLINKADMMTLKQRRVWAKFFEKLSINFRFFSAELAKQVNESHDYDRDSVSDSGSDSDSIDNGEESESRSGRQQIQSKGNPFRDQEDDRSVSSYEENTDKILRETTRILTTDELEAVFLEYAPIIEADQDGLWRKTQIGLVGYPNVGKSSTINALIGSKKVSVSATPGKTKHFQTIHLSDSVILCDCPGLVFPNFATTKAELVCNGILPIDQLREYTGPAALIAQRIPQPFLESTYGIKIITRPLEEGGTGIPTGEELLRAYAKARGFFTTGQGQPDESRAARYVLKDYVKGKLLFCHPPPGHPSLDFHHFNSELYDSISIADKRKPILLRQEDGSSETSDVSPPMGDQDLNTIPSLTGCKSEKLDKGFFRPRQAKTGHVARPFQHRFTEHENSLGKQLSGRKYKAMTALENGIAPENLRMNSKKHFKANKRKEKQLRASYDL